MTSVSRLRTSVKNADALASAISVLEEVAAAADSEISPTELLKRAVAAVQANTAEERPAAGPEERYVRRDALLKMLSPDESVGGTPIKLLRARWLLEHFRVHTTATLVSRQECETAHPDAFADAAMVSAIVNECEHANDLFGFMCFPSLVCLSHCWLSMEAPDPDGRNLREIWRPALLWYYCERVKLACKWRREAASPEQAAASQLPWHVARWAGLSDADLLSRCDFGVFVE